MGPHAPSAEGCCGEAEAGSELFLSHAHLGAHGLHVDGARAMHVHAPLVAPGVGDGLLQALLDALG